MDKNTRNIAQPETQRSWAIKSVMTLTVFLTIGCVGAVTAAFQLRGSFGQAMIVAMAFFACLVLMGISILLYLDAARLRNHGRLRVANIAAGMLVVLALQAPGYVFGRLLLRHDIREAKLFCEQLVEPLDQYRQQHGSYPTDIAKVLPANTPIPPILKNNYYHSNGEYFTFDFANPGGMFNGYEYYSTDHRWEYWD